MFDQLQVLPRPLRKVHLLCVTDMPSAAHAMTLQGRSLSRLRHDARLVQHVGAGIPVASHDSWLRAQSSQYMADVFQGGADGLVWLRRDALLDDYFLVERLAEAWSFLPSVEIRDAGGALVLWALSRPGLQKWTEAVRQDGKAGKQDVFVAPPVTGAFGEADLAQARAAGVKSAVWPLSVSLAQEPQQADASLRLTRPAAVPVPWTGPRKVPPLLLVSASRESPERFMTETALGRSVARLKAHGADLRIMATCNNTASLASVYNRALVPDYRDYIIVFVHDDVWIDDVFIAQRLHEALLRHDVIGVAGSRNRIPLQAAWPFPRKRGEWDLRDNLLGAVAHEVAGKNINDQVTSYGAARGSARLMDGVLLAVRGSVVIPAGLRFDELFPFHFYDLDFCRSAERRGLRLGVWPLAITHLSGGNFGSLDWHAAWANYASKWNE